MENPRLILLFSGKRKSGKDYICETLKEKLGEENYTIIRISGPLKRLYAESHNLTTDDVNEMMTDGPLKEKFRAEMIQWSDEIRVKDPGFFCKAATKMAESRPFWIVSDIRRKTDIQWFKNTYKDKIIKLIRVEADEMTRQKRGWIFTEGVDNVTSECDLDDFNDWDLIIKNNTSEELREGLGKFMLFFN
ncbi:phosphomevalonate kinase isoform X2 [Tribolium madens]|uniref:phosphomevalonate kinase isoform X2 n=1 Tax=Tribolium madens TaxID=41895 RepID=UPI001CF72B22|nr:phosphomevalonate kinase isoform X2 [Tribolium madens]